MKILVSACLLGENCKYNGESNYSEKVAALLKDNEVIAVCPEVMGGLSVPRSPCEIVDGVVYGKDGVCVDEQFRSGAQRAMVLARVEKVDEVILQSRSPSCGVNQIYDGSFTGGKIPGHGVFAQLLIDNGFKVIDVEDL